MSTELKVRLNRDRLDPPERVELGRIRFMLTRLGLRHGH